jgi:5-(carboxyamino)imidazole ribonucleotide synthase
MKHRLGIVGGGQLGKMLAGPARDLGFHVTVLDPNPACPASADADEVMVGDFADADAIRALAERSDFLTYEIELANADVLEEVARAGVKVNPSPATLRTIQDKLRQREFLQAAGLPVPAFRQADTVEEIRAAADALGYPVLLKARRGGYDGRGNQTVRAADDITAAWEQLGKREVYVEAFLRFDKELAVIAALGMDGDIRTYDAVETIHTRHILQTALAPAPVAADIRTRAQQVAHDVMAHLDGAGVFGIELFLMPDGEIYINEIAPRVHNSGHHTIEACVTSQFEQQVRAVTGLPLGDTALKVPAAVMVNILGERAGTAEPRGAGAAGELPGVAVHLYGKTEVRVDRKMGHVTAVGADPDAVRRSAESARARITL